MIPSAHVVDQFVQRARGLYSLPAVAMRVLELTASPKVDVRALKECLENDPALTTRILRVVNSSLFGLSREVTDLNQALALLGIKPLKMLVLGFSLPKRLFAALEADVLSRYWRHTLTKAVVAREISQRYWHQPGDDAFIAGLLQEIGQLVLIQDLGEPYVRFVDRVHSSGGDLPALELETLGFDHAILSARLLHHWGFPEAIVRAIGAPHRAPHILSLPPHEQALPQILHLADLLARLLTSERAPPIDELLDVCRDYRRLTIDDLPTLLDDLDAKVAQLAEVLNLQLAEGVDYRSVLADAHTQLASVAGEVAVEMLEPAAMASEMAALAQAAADLALSPAPRREELPSAPVPLGAASATSAAAHASATLVLNDTWSDPGLVGKLNAALHVCRQHRHPLSVLLAEVDNFDQWVLTRGMPGTLSLMDRLQQVLASELDPGSSCVHLGDSHFALVLVDYDRQASLDAARHIGRRVHELGQPLLEGATPVLSLSIGLASLNVPPKNFPASELISAARRCLSAAQLSGGNSVKSIELV